jgi:hypothetical protein
MANSAVGGATPKPPGDVWTSKSSVSAEATSVPRPSMVAAVWQRAPVFVLLVGDRTRDVVGTDEVAREVAELGVADIGVCFAQSDGAGVVDPAFGLGRVRGHRQRLDASRAPVLLGCGSLTADCRALCIRPLGDRDRCGDHDFREHRKGRDKGNRGC